MPRSTPSRSFILATLSCTLMTLITPASGQVINEDRKLTAADAALGHVFGSAMASDNGIVAVGASGGERAYTFNATTGAQIAFMVPIDPPSRSFGFSIDIDAGIVAIGARWDNDNGVQSGSAYLFSGTTGQQLRKLLPLDGASDEFFGRSIAIDGGLVAVGAMWDGGFLVRRGAAYIFDASNGAQLFKLEPFDGANSDEFGYSIAMGDGVVAVGSIGDDDGASGSGSVYLYDASTGLLIRKINPSDPGNADSFGSAVAIDNGILAVGSYHDNNNNNDNGSVYLFDLATGNELFKLFASDSAGGDQFGISISMDNGILAVGADLNDDAGTESGSAYLFDVATGTEIAKLLPSDGSAWLHFGQAVAISGSQAVVGMPSDPHSGNNSGSAYVYTVPTPPCAADLTNDGILDFFDISAFLTDQIDWNEDTVFDFFDISGYLTAFSTGCP